LPILKAFLHFIQISTTIWSARFAVEANKLEQHNRFDVKKRKKGILVWR